jgi:hypothetical protein
MTTAADDARRCALALLASLDEQQRRLVRGDLADSDLRQWTYLPGDRPGLSMEHLTGAQHALAVELLRSAHSSEGGDLAVGAVEIERVRRELATGSPPDGDRYWVRVLGDPSGELPWGWRINGHHLAVHVVVAPGGTTITPHFVGSEPAVVPSGPHAGRRILGPEEDLARQLATGLDPYQRAVGISADVAPDDILTPGRSGVADPSLLPEGIARDLLRPAQQQLLDQLVQRYLNPRAGIVCPSLLARGRGGRPGPDPVRVGRPDRTRRGPLLHTRTQVPHRVRQHPRRRQPRPFRMATPAPRLGRRPAQGSLRTRPPS